MGTPTVSFRAAGKRLVPEPGQRDYGAQRVPLRRDIGNPFLESGYALWAVAVRVTCQPRNTVLEPPGFHAPSRKGKDTGQGCCKHHPENCGREDGGFGKLPFSWPFISPDGTRYPALPDAFPSPKRVSGTGRYRVLTSGAVHAILQHASNCRNGLSDRMVAGPRQCPRRKPQMQSSQQRKEIKKMEKGHIEWRRTDDHRWYAPDRDLLHAAAPSSRAPWVQPPKKHGKRPGNSNLVTAVADPTKPWIYSRNYCGDFFVNLKGRTACGYVPGQHVQKLFCFRI